MSAPLHPSTEEMLAEMAGDRFQYASISRYRTDRVWFHAELHEGKVVQSGHADTVAGAIEAALKAAPFDTSKVAA